MPAGTVSERTLIGWPSWSATDRASLILCEFSPPTFRFGGEVEKRQQLKAAVNFSLCTERYRQLEFDAGRGEHDIIFLAFQNSAAQFVAKLPDSVSDRYLHLCPLPARDVNTAIPMMLSRLRLSRRLCC